MTDELALADLAADFPGWHIWRGRDGRGRDADWHATRRRRPGVPRAGMPATLGAGSPASLRALLGQQQALEGSTQERAA